MKLIVISSLEPIPNEKEITIALFEKGLKTLHLYKPTLSEEEIQNYIRSFPEKYHDKIKLHSSFPKFHSIKELENYKRDFSYAFLSPIFDSISKNGYKSRFDLKELKAKLPLINKNIIALGGIDENKIELVRELGFAGVGILGAIWKSDNPVEKFVRLKALCQKKDLMY